MGLISLYADWRTPLIGAEKGLRIANSIGNALGRSPATWTAGRFFCADTAGSRGWKPAHTPRGEIVLLSGFIQNRDEIEGEIGETCRDDADLYASAYALWGDDADLRLVGQFSTIIVHPDELWVRVCRSPILAPPLHIWSDEARLIVASIPGPLFATGEVPRKIDEQKIADTLFLNYAEVERSYFEGVERIPTGSVALYQPGRKTLNKYYDLLSRPTLRLSRDEDYVEQADSLFAHATKTSVQDFSNLAVSLSGGYDSQAVAVYAMEAGRRVKGFTSVPEPDWDGYARPNGIGDERHHVAAFASMHPKLSVEYVDAAGLSFGHHLQATSMLMGGPPRNAMNLHWIHDIRARARSLGHDVILEGSLGNIGFSFGGEGALPNWFLTGNWSRLLRELSAGKEASSLIRYFSSQVLVPFMPQWLWRLALQNLGRTPISAMDSWCPMNSEWAREMRVEERASDMAIDAYYRASRSTRKWRSDVLTELMNEGGEFQLAMETLHGVPSRDPTAYRPFLEFCVSIPDDQYLRNGKSRWLAKRLLKGKIPDMVLSEKRRGQQAADWHLRLGRERHELIAEIDRLSDDPGMQARFNLPALRKALEEWPATTPADQARAYRLELAVSRGLTTARFIRAIEGRN